MAASNKITTTDRSLLGQLKDLLFLQGRTLGGESDDRINIMLTAIGGEGHKGRNLADTVMVASLKPSTGQIALLSIPRDLYVQVPGEEYYAKINAVHAYGESKKKDHGPITLREAVIDVTNLPIHYYARVDFVAFKEIIDALGGINITIDNTFYDYWHKISFSAGAESMDGERALAYVRARYIEGPEGGDFKRAARQQQVLLSLRDKLFSVNTAFDFAAANTILKSLSDNIRTDMSLWEMKRLYELARQVDRNSVRSVVLTTGPEGVLEGTTEILGDAPASVLKPKAGNFSAIHEIAQNLFLADQTNGSATTSEPAEEAPVEEPEQKEEPAAKPTIEIRNGTNITGLAKKTSDNLAADGYEVSAIGNAFNRAAQKTTVYTLNPELADTIISLAESLGATAESGLPPGEASSEADVLIILGPDADEF
ncbi:LCP family protein [Patescibacteria group bacterium]|nr:LCP family protein [Patescibacteria group bacterium]